MLPGGWTYEFDTYPRNFDHNHSERDHIFTRFGAIFDLKFSFIKNFKTFSKAPQVPKCS